MSNLRKIGQKILKARKQAGMTQEDLAGLTEMDRSYLSEIENGHKNFSILVLFRLAKALKIPPSALID